MILVKILFSLIWLVDVLSFVGCLPVLLFIMLIWHQLNSLGNFSFQFHFSFQGICFHYKWSLMIEEKVWIHSITFYCPRIDFLELSLFCSFVYKIGKVFLRYYKTGVLIHENFHFRISFFLVALHWFRLITFLMKRIDSNSF